MREANVINNQLHNTCMDKKHTDDMLRNRLWYLSGTIKVAFGFSMRKPTLQKEQPVVNNNDEKMNCSG
jgi:hypothetical protein